MKRALIRNHVVVTGRGPPLVFAHGFGCDQTVWARLAPRFEADFTVVRFDYVGAGRSDRSAYDSARYATIQGYAQDLLEVCSALELSQAVLVGHSVSSMIGAHASVAAPEVFRRLLMLVPSPRFVDDPPDYRGGFDRSDIDNLLELMDANFMGWANALSQMVLDVPELARELRESFLAADPRILREFARVAFLSDSRDVLPSVQVPCLVVQSTRDSIVPVAVGEYLARRLPRARYALLDAPGHMPHMSHPNEVEAILRADLARADLERE